MNGNFWKIVDVSRPPLQLLHDAGGFYECPKDPHGARRGPLVGYAGKYDAPDGTKKHKVGDVYFNFAKAEQYAHVRDAFARPIAQQLESEVKPDVFLAAPWGGILFAESLGRMLNRRVIFAEKKVTAVATAESREQSVIELVRHEIMPGDMVGLVEDVCNNYTTTDLLMRLVEDAGGNVVLIACAVNRSPLSMYGLTPVLSTVHEPTPQCEQEDPSVADDIANGNVVWKPKDEWPRLMKAMEAAKFFGTPIS